MRPAGRKAPRRQDCRSPHRANRSDPGRSEAAAQTQEENSAGTWTTIIAPGLWILRREEPECDRIASRWLFLRRGCRKDAAPSHFLIRAKPVATLRSRVGIRAPLRTAEYPPNLSRLCWASLQCELCPGLTDPERFDKLEGV